MNDVFLLNGELDLVKKEALYLWANRRMEGHLLPYEQLQRICNQLTEHAHQQQWTLQVGGGWNIIRNGMALYVKRPGMNASELAENKRLRGQLYKMGINHKVRTPCSFGCHQAPTKTAHLSCRV